MGAQFPPPKKKKKGGCWECARERVGGREKERDGGRVRERGRELSKKPHWHKAILEELRKNFTLFKVLSTYGLLVHRNIEIVEVQQLLLSSVRNAYSRRPFQRTCYYDYG